MKRRIGLTTLSLGLVALLSAVALTTTAGSTPHRRPARGPAPAWLAVLAGRVALECRDAAPSAAMYCRTTEGMAGPAVDAAAHKVAEPRRPVYLVVLRGQFVDPRIVVLSDPARPRAELGATCSYVVFSADLRTHELLDLGLADTRMAAPHGAHWARFAIPASLVGHLSDS